MEAAPCSAPLQRCVDGAADCVRASASLDAAPAADASLNLRGDATPQDVFALLYILRGMKPRMTPMVWALCGDAWRYVVMTPDCMLVQEAKAAAMGPRRNRAAAREVLAEPLLSVILDQADKAQDAGWFWTYDLKHAKVGAVMRRLALAHAPSIRLPC